LRWWRWRVLLARRRSLPIAVPITVAVAAGILRGKSLFITELEVRYFGDVEGIHAISNRHPNLTGIASEVLAVNHAAAAERK
jgi:hypothetical protein